MSKYPLIISTDIGTDVDDALAVYLATTAADVDLQAVWVTSGDVDLRAKIARKLLHLSGSRAKVLIGEGYPLDGETRSLVMHGYEKGLLTPREHYRSLAWDIERSGLESVVHMIDSNPGFSILSIAPMTNIARLIKARPDISDKIERIYVMGGSLGRKEFNFGCDPQAVQVVLESDLSLTVFPTEVCNRYRIPSNLLMNQLPNRRSLNFISEMAEALRNYNAFRDALPNIKETLRLKKIYCTGDMQPQEFLRDGQLIESLRELVNTTMTNVESATSVIIQINYLAQKYREMRILKEFFDLANLKDYAVHDVYALFGLLYPEYTRKVSASLEVDSEGVCEIRSDGKHEFVLNLDYSKFEEFLLKGLSLKPSEE